MSEEEVRILIVGGTGTERQECRDVLANAPEYEYTFDEAATAEEALGLFESRKPDAVVLFCELEDMAPHEFVAELAARSSVFCTSVLAIADNGQRSVLRKVMAAGATDYLTRDQVEPLILGRIVRYSVEATWAEKKQEELRTLFKTILTAMPGFLALKNRDRVYQAMNPAFCRFLGKVPGEIMGRRDEDLFSEDEARAARDADMEVLESGVMQSGEVQLTGIDGGRPLQVNRSPIVDADGVRAGILWTARDLALARRREAADADEGEDDWDDPGEEPEVELNVEFQPSYRLTLADANFCDAVGRSGEDLVGQSFRSLVPHEDQDHLNKNLALLTKDRPEGDCLHRILTASGEPVLWEWNYRAIFNDRGRLESFCGTATPHKEARSETKECPECAELIRARARKCRFCGHMFQD